MACTYMKAYCCSSTLLQHAMNAQGTEHVSPASGYVFWVCLPAFLRCCMLTVSTACCSEYVGCHCAVHASLSTYSISPSNVGCHCALHALVSPCSISPSVVHCAILSEKAVCCACMHFAYTGAFTLRWLSTVHACPWPWFMWSLLQELVLFSLIVVFATGFGCLFNLLCCCPI